MNTAAESAPNTKSRLLESNPRAVIPAGLDEAFVGAHLDAPAHALYEYATALRVLERTMPLAEARSCLAHYQSLPGGPRFVHTVPPVVPEPSVDVQRAIGLQEAVQTPFLASMTRMLRDGPWAAAVVEFARQQAEPCDASRAVAESICLLGVVGVLPVRMFDHESTTPLLTGVRFLVEEVDGVCFVTRQPE